MSPKPCARCTELEAKVAEWQEITRGANEFWRGLLEESSAKHALEVKVLRAKLRRLRAELDDKERATSRRGDGAPHPARVFREYALRRPTCASEKEAELAVGAALGYSDRTVRRLLLGFRDQVERSMKPLDLTEPGDAWTLTSPKRESPDR